MRRLYVAARRKLMRHNRGIGSSPLAFLETSYRDAKRNFRSAIRKAKAQCWQELISNIDEDPWGLPYRLVLNRLRSSTPCLTETLDSSALNSNILLDSLFPVGVTHDPFAFWGDVSVNPDCDTIVL